jgi:hypothetical protein
MTKSLGDFNIERSSSSDTKNITWSQKTTSDEDKRKKKNSHKIPKNTSATNIVYAKTEEETSVERIFVIEQSSDSDKTKKKNLDRKFENSSASNCNIQQGFKRPSR